MPFDPNLPQPHLQLDANVVRIQLNALNDKIDAVPAGPPGPQGPKGDPGSAGPEADPVFSAWLATQPPVSAFTNDAGFSKFNPNNTGELYSCFGIFDGGNITNGVRVGGNQVDLQLYNGGQTVVVLSAGQKQLIGYADYANPVPLVAACWADGVLRDGNGQAFITGAITPGNPGLWAGTPPATQAEHNDRIAAAVASLLGTPIP